MKHDTVISHLVELQQIPWHYIAQRHRVGKMKDFERPLMHRNMNKLTVSGEVHLNTLIGR